MEFFEIFKSTKLKCLLTIYILICIHMKNHLYTAGTDDLHIPKGGGEENIEPSVFSVQLL